MRIWRWALISLVLLLAACQNRADEASTDVEVDVEVGAEVEEPAAQEEPAAPVEAESAVEEKTEDSVSEPAASEDGQESPGGPEEVTITAADGLTIFGTFTPGSGQGARPGVLLLHMNGGRRGDWTELAGQLAEAGYASLAIDMRGHGQTGETKDWEQAKDDVARAWNALAGRAEVDGTKTATVGASVGANLALVTGAAEPTIQTAVLLSPGLDYLGVTTDDAVVAYGERPLFLVASEEDRVAADSARALFELATGEKRLEIFDGAGHGTSMFGPRPDLSDMIIGWLNEHLLGTTVAAEPAKMAGLPAPTLFELEWGDRSPFRSGLVDSEAAVLDQLPGASVYHMDLSISPDLLTVDGRLEVRYTNQEEVPLDEIHFHLFPNLLGGRTDISALTVNGQSVQPEYVHGESILRVPLAAPLAPGGQAVVGLAFQVQVPTEGGSNYGVFASIEGVLALAHFYPQISVYDDEGWNIAPPPANADVTYADTSFYLVRITAPVEQVLVVSGVETERQASGSEQTVTYAAGPMRDFYLASSARYTVASRQVGQTTINSYGFAQFNEQIEHTLQIAADAMESFNARFGRYPFSEFDVAPTPNLALGVEYPGVVVIRDALYDPDATLGQTPAGFYLEGTVAHEVGHQWFYSLVGNDQLDEPWVDESLVQYATYLYFVDTYGERNAEGFRQSFFDRWDRVERAEIPIGMPAGNYQGTEYSAIVYGRGPLFFDTLEDEMGEATFAAFLKEYSQRNKWGIATGDGLQALAEEHCGCDLSELFAAWVTGT